MTKTKEDINLLYLNEWYTVSDIDNSIFEIEEEEMNILIENAATEAGFTRWLRNWDKMYDYRSRINNGYNETDLGTYIILEFLRFGPLQVGVRNNVINWYAILDDPNDLNEISEFLDHCIQFAKILTEKVYGKAIIEGEPREQLSTINSLKPLLELLRNSGFLYHLSYTSKEIKIILNNNLTIYLVADYYNDKEFFRFVNDEDRNYSLIVNTVNVKEKIEKEGDLFIQAVHSKALADLYIQKKSTIPVFEEESKQYQVDLVWNNNAKEIVAVMYDYDVFRSYDGFIAFKEASPLCFRPTLEEIKDYTSEQ